MELIAALSAAGLLVLKRKTTWTDYIGGSKSAGADQISIRIPETALSTLTLCTTKEDISLPTLTVTNQLALSTNGGNISFENISATNSITVENKSGDIAGTITGSYDDYAITYTIKKGKHSISASQHLILVTPRRKPTKFLRRFLTISDWR